MKVSWDQVFGWRVRRQFVDPRSDGDAVAVVRRLCGVQAQVTSAAETAVALRRSQGTPGAVVAALGEGTLVKTWAMRGTLHALTPELGAAALSLMASARTWEKPAWTKVSGATPEDVAALVKAVGAILDRRVLTRDELVGELIAEPRFQPLETHLRSGWGSMLKPLAWQGALCHGPSRGTSITFGNPAHLIPGWTGIPDPEVAAPLVIRAYLGAYGPATPEIFNNWLTRNFLSKTIVRKWFSQLGDELTEIEVEGRKGFFLTEHLEELAATEPTSAVHLLGQFDQYVLGPGTGDSVLLPADHRAKVSRTAGWISPLVLIGGRIAGTWELDKTTLVVSMFDGAPVPSAAIRAELPRLATATGLPIESVRAAPTPTSRSPRR
ncbi:winged helix DNA-binding domain-containing protein [Nocardia yunnanensis]|uniref:Winged helix DNA-binding domain-containing protein n=1 Tax=Nocardia yunnanensis TaxID=2382165 RepID=A0A386ZFY5_9NOCA|nr:winged helix DNA-binding domain-containing protein [Nocardia yunnanensis]AYF76438.1 winged helix DNA-binding domain-containing protein [Nocardia yunnanensis]